MTDLILSDPVNPDKNMIFTFSSLKMLNFRAQVMLLNRTFLLELINPVEEFQSLSLSVFQLF